MTLTQARAESRFAAIKTESIRYRFHLILNPTHYDGLSEIEFTLNNVPQELVLDLKTKEIKKLVINESNVEKWDHDGVFLTLNSELLKVGENVVTVQYRNKYDNDGNGCVSFIDVDTKQYIYTQFEPFNAQRVFGLFDQPDLKATMELSIVSPKEWESVLSNEYPTVDQDFTSEVYLSKASTRNPQILADFSKEASGRLSIFPSSKMLPTYLYCFVAGPYKRLALKEAERYNNIPMSLYCIESLFTYLEGMAPFIFEITIECMRFFESFFGVKYPFNKYDQVFAHEYKFGAMENAGIVTFNDLYIWKEKVSTETMLDLANTISHELSHHWFGNLSTMKWWDDLWLNESFAEFISHFSLDKIRNGLKTIKYESAMSAFLSRKAWGYHEDQLITTHPIAGEVANTSIAESIFDGITYSKGAATMKQLLLLMGEENFSKGLTSFFTKYGFKNATLSDFINELQIYFTNEELTLPEWKKYWLETASLNVLEPFWKPEDNSENAQLEIIQTPFASDYPTLRPHRIKIAFFKEDSSFDVIEVTIKPQEKTVVPYNGTNNYKAVLLNYEDHTFAKILLDKASIDFFSSGNLVKIADTLTRTLIWRSFFDMVKDGVISSIRYIDIFEHNIPNELSDGIYERHFDYTHTTINTYTPRKYRSELNARLFFFILQQIQNVDQSNENRLVILRNQLFNYGGSLVATRILLAWRNKKYSPLAEHEMTVVQKWKVVVHAFSQKEISDEEKKNLLADQLTLDQSDSAKLQEARCKSLISSEEEFERLYASFKDPQNEQSIALKRDIIQGWNHHYHSERLSNYKKRYFTDLSEVSKVLEGDHLDIFLEEVLPRDDNIQETIDGLKGVKFGDEEKHDKIRREVLKTIGDLERKLKAYEKFEAFDSI